MRWRGSLPIVVLAMMTFPSACGDECRAGEAKCEDNVALTCSQSSEDSPLKFLREDCGAMHCVSVPSNSAMIYTSAFCAADPTPDPNCQPTTVVGYCKTPTLAETCHYGYRVKEIQCQGPDRCAVTRTDAKCQSPRAGLACFDASLYVGGDAANWVCTSGPVRGMVDESCPTTALPAVPDPPSAGCWSTPAPPERGDTRPRISRFRADYDFADRSTTRSVVSISTRPSTSPVSTRMASTIPSGSG